MRALTRAVAVAAWFLLPAAALAQAPRTGELVTRQGGVEIGRERWRDDGRTLTSEVTLAGQSFTSTITRSPAHVRVTAHGQSVDADVPSGAVALPNGQWEAYAILTERFPAATTGTRVSVIVPGTPTPVPANLVVTVQNGARTLRISLGPLAVTVELAADGTVRHAEVPAQNIVVDLASVAAPPPPVTTLPPPPAGVREEPIDVARGTLHLRGALWMPPRARRRVAVALIIAGSGPTDREGNDVGLGLRTNLYRKLAAALAQAGIASVRFDKRGVGASDMPAIPAAAVLDDFVGDAAAVALQLRHDRRFGKLTVIGHSEGGVIAIEVARAMQLDALVLVATPGRPMAALLREQLNRAHDAATGRAVDAALDAVRHDQAPDPRSPVAALFAPGVRAFVRSELDLDPSAHFGETHAPAAIIQGETDAQVRLDDARALATIRADAHLTTVPRMNHVLCEEASVDLPQASYTDPSCAVVQAALDAIVAGVAR